MLVVHNSPWPGVHSKGHRQLQMTSQSLWYIERMGAARFRALISKNVLRDALKLCGPSRKIFWFNFHLRWSTISSDGSSSSCTRVSRSSKLCHPHSSILCLSPFSPHLSSLGRWCGLFKQSCNIVQNQTSWFRFLYSSLCILFLPLATSSLTGLANFHESVWGGLCSDTCVGHQRLTLWTAIYNSRDLFYSPPQEGSCHGSIASNG